MKTELGAAIKDLRKERNMSQEALGNVIGVDKGNISRYESGKQFPELDKISNIAEALGVEVWELFAKAQGCNFSEASELYKVPLISWVQAGNYNDVFLDPTNLDNLEWVETTYKARKFTYALRVVGDSMEPKFPEGCVIIVEPEEQPHNKSYVIAVLQDSNKATFKQLIDDESGKYLKPLNEKYPIMNMQPTTGFCGVVKKMQMDV